MNERYTETLTKADKSAELLFKLTEEEDKAELILDICKKHKNKCVNIGKVRTTRDGVKAALDIVQKVYPNIPREDIFHGMMHFTNDETFDAKKADTIFVFDRQAFGNGPDVIAFEFNPAYTH